MFRFGKRTKVVDLVKSMLAECMYYSNEHQVSCLFDLQMDATSNVIIARVLYFTAVRNASTYRPISSIFGIATHTYRIDGLTNSPLLMTLDG